MKTILVCAILLHPSQGEGYATTVLRVNLKREDKCRIEAGQYNAKKGRNDCFCEEKRSSSKIKALPTPLEKK